MHDSDRFLVVGRTGVEIVFSVEETDVRSEELLDSPFSCSKSILFASAPDFEDGETSDRVR